MSDKIQLAKIAMSYAGAAKSGATTEYERQMADAIWFLAQAISQDMTDRRKGVR